MIVPSWQEIIDDILEVLALRHPALQDSSAVNILTISSESDSRDDVIEDMLDALVVHKFNCGHTIKVPLHLYDTLQNDLTDLCQSCYELR